jgi:palmitoyltransferase ZDHHC9/14/18
MDVVIDVHIIQIRNQAHTSLVPGPAPPNPFSHGSWRKNLANVLCRPEGFSWLNASAVLTDDRREVNPGLRAALS